MTQALVPPDDLLAPPDDLIGGEVARGLTPPDDLIQPPDDLIGGAPPVPREERRGALGRGIETGLRSLPSTFGGGIEAYGRALDMPRVQRLGEYLGSLGTVEDLAPQDRAQMRLRDIRGLSDALSFAGEQLGSALASMAPTIASGAAGAGVGSIAGPKGAVVGGITGAVASSLPMNTGDLYGALVDEGVDKQRAAQLAAQWGPVITAPDVFATGSVLRPFMGEGGKVATKSFARYLAGQAGRGAAVEAGTEAAQQAVQEAVIAAETGNLNAADRLENIATAAIGGGLGGGAVRGGAAAFARPRQEAPLPPQAPSETGTPSIDFEEAVARVEPGVQDDRVVYGYRDREGADARPVELLETRNDGTVVFRNLDDQGTTFVVEQDEAAERITDPPRNWAWYLDPENAVNPAMSRGQSPQTEADVAARMDETGDIVDQLQRGERATVTDERQGRMDVRAETAPYEQRIRRDDDTTLFRRGKSLQDALDNATANQDETINRMTLAGLSVEQAEAQAQSDIADFRDRLAAVRAEIERRQAAGRYEIPRDPDLRNSRFGLLYARPAMSEAETGSLTAPRVAPPVRQGALSPVSGSEAETGRSLTSPRVAPPAPQGALAPVTRSEAEAGSMTRPNAPGFEARQGSLRPVAASVAETGVSLTGAPRTAQELARARATRRQQAALQRKLERRAKRGVTERDVPTLYNLINRMGIDKNDPNAADLLEALKAGGKVPSNIVRTGGATVDDILGAAAQAGMLGPDRDSTIYSPNALYSAAQDARNVFDAEYASEAADLLAQRRAENRNPDVDAHDALADENEGYLEILQDADENASVADLVAYATDLNEAILLGDLTEAAQIIEAENMPASAYEQEENLEPIDSQGRGGEGDTEGAGEAAATATERQADAGTDGGGAQAGDQPQQAGGAGAEGPTFERVQGVEGATEQGVVPGAEQRPEESAQAQKKAETQTEQEIARLKGEQSKMRGNKPQQGPGGMFGPSQGTLMSGVNPLDIPAHVRALVQDLGRLFGYAGRKARLLGTTALQSTAFANAVRRAADTYNGVTRWIGETFDATMGPTIRKFGALPVSLAERYPLFARAFQAEYESTGLLHRIQQTGAEALRPLTSLPPESRIRVYKMLDAISFAGADPSNLATAKRLVFTTPQNYAGEALVPGQTIRLNEAETDAVRAVRKFLDERHNKLWEAIARRLQYRGPWTQSAASRSPDVKKIWDAMEASRRAGYMPRMRKGDLYIKATIDDGSGGVETVWFEGVESRPFEAARVKSGRTSDRLNALAQERKRELEKKYGAGKVTVETGSREIYEEAKRANAGGMFASVDDLDSIFAVMNDPKFRNNENAKNLLKGLSDKIIEANKAGFLKRQRNVPGYTPDFDWTMQHYNLGTASSIARNTYAEQVVNAETALMDPKASPPWLREFYRSWRNGIDQDESAILRGLRSIGYYQTILGSVASALTNLTQTPVLTVPGIIAVGGKAGNVGTAMRDVMRGINFTKTEGLGIDASKIGRTPDERAFLRDLELRGELDPQITDDFQGAGGLVSTGMSAPGQQTSAYADRWRRGVDAMGNVLSVVNSTMRSAETANRAIASLAAYRAAKEGGAKFTEGFEAYYKNDARWRDFKSRNGGATPKNMAIFFSQDTNFIGGMINRPAYARNVGGVAFQYVYSYFQNFFRRLRYAGLRAGWRGAAAVAMITGAMLLFSGSDGLPGTESADKLASTIARAAGWTDPEFRNRFDLAVREALVSGFGKRDGEMFAQMFKYGPVSVLTGVDLRRRIGMGDVVPQVLQAQTPIEAVSSLPAFSSLKHVGAAIDALMQDSPDKALVKGLQAVAPAGARGAIEAAMVYPERGVTTARGWEIVSPEELTPQDYAKRALGFQPLRVGEGYERYMEEQSIRRNTDAAKQRANQRLINMYTEVVRAERAGKPKRDIDRLSERFQTELDRQRDAFDDPNTPDYRKVKPMDLRTIQRAVDERLGERDRRTPRLKREEIERRLGQ